MRNRRLTLPLSLLLLAAPLAAADGELDPTFWGDGTVVLGGTGSFGISAVVVAPDDRVVVVGTHDPGDGVWDWYWRAVGDTAAGSGCYFSPPGDGFLGQANAAAFDSAGRLLVAGWGGFWGDEQMAVARFSYPACTLDDSFDDDGYWTLHIAGGTEVLTAIAVHPDTGQIALGGHYANDDQTSSLVCLLDGAGEPVDSFSGDGLLGFHTQSSAEIDRPVADVAFDNAGNILVATTYFFGPNAEWLVARLTPAGTFDSTFGDGDGVQRIFFDLGGQTADEDRVFALARDPNTGNLLVVGEAQTQTGYALAIARLLPSGALDETFSGDGKVDLSFGNAHTRLEDVAVDSLGRLLVAGFLDYPTGDSDVVALRFNANGALDPSFGYGGLSLIAFDFGPDPHEDDYGRALAIQAGRVVVAGDVEANADSDFLPGLARLENALIFADGFESGGTARWSSAN